MKKYSFTSLFILSLALLCCQPTKQEKSTSKVIIREKSDASTLNPIAASDQLSFYAGQQIFQSLLAIDYSSEKMIGIIAQSPPLIEQNENKEMVLTYTIRPEARFDNGRKITANDILFSLKINICPLVQNSNGANYYSFIKDFIILNDQSFQIICNKTLVLNQFRSGDFFIVPPEIYDSSHILSHFSLQRLFKNDQLEENDSIIRLANAFNHSVQQSSAEYFIGSGAYQLKKWEKEERIVLERKGNWWGEALKGENSYFNALVDEIQFEIVNDAVTAVNALKADQIDFIHALNASDYIRLEKHPSIETESVLRYGYQYLGFNCNDPILSDKNVRKAIELAIPFEKIVDVIFQGEAIVNRLPLPLQMKELRNTKINFKTNDLEKAQSYLSASNWKDDDNDQVLDKDGVPLSLTYYYNSGNDERKGVGILLQNELKKIGIQLKVKSMEWTSYLKALRNNEIQLFMSGFLSLPLPPDFTNALHSKSANGGRNYANYQNPNLDLLIDSVKLELTDSVRTKLIKEIQAIVAEETPYVYLLSTYERIAYSKKLQNVPLYGIRPHFWAPELY